MDEERQRSGENDDLKAVTGEDDPNNEGDEVVNDAVEETNEEIQSKYCDDEEEAGDEGDDGGGAVDGVLVDDSAQIQEEDEVASPDIPVEEPSAH